MPNSAPTKISLQRQVVKENAAGVAIGTLTAKDRDTGETFTFASLSADYVVEGNTLRLAPGKALDFEALPRGTASVQVQVTDSAGNTLVQTVTFKVTDVNGFTFTPVAEVANLTPGAVLGTVTLNDPVPGRDVTWDVWNYVSTGLNRLAEFEVVGDTLRLRHGLSLDHAAGTSVRLGIWETETGQPDIYQEFTLPIAAAPTLPANPLSSAGWHHPDSNAPPSQNGAADIMILEGQTFDGPAVDAISVQFYSTGQTGGPDNQGHPTNGGDAMSVLRDLQIGGSGNIHALALDVFAKGGFGRGPSGPGGYEGSGTGGDAFAHIDGIDISTTLNGDLRALAIGRTGGVEGTASASITDLDVDGPDFSYASTWSLQVSTQGRVSSMQFSDNILHLGSAPGQSNIVSVLVDSFSYRNTIQFEGNTIFLNGSGANALFLGIGASNYDDEQGYFWDPLDDVLTFSGNIFDGGAGTGNIFDYSFPHNSTGIVGAGVTIDVAAGTLRIGNSPLNTLRNFDTFVGNGHDTFIDGPGHQSYHFRSSPTYAGEFGSRVVFAPGHGDDDVFWLLGQIGDQHRNAIELHGFGARFDSFAEVVAKTKDVAGFARIKTPDGGSISLDVAVADLTAADFIFS